MLQANGEHQSCHISVSGVSYRNGKIIGLHIIRHQP